MAILRTLQQGKNRVAVLLSGCGVYDGAEIHESVFALNRLSRLKANAHCFAPNQNQMHVVDHLTGSEEKGASARNCLREAARISRGANTFALTELLGKINDYDALIVPGGFGAAKNLSDFGPVGGPEFTVNPDVKRVLQEFHAAKKPIGLSCIAPVIAARVFEKSGLKMTVGGETEGSKWPYAGTAGAINALGCVHVETSELVEAGSATFCVDQDNKIVTAAAYMCGEAPMHEVEESMNALVDKTCELIA